MDLTPLSQTDFDTAWARSPLLLDGACGTELERCGCAGPPPLWSSQALLDAPEQVRTIHAGYVEAGSDILIANTFRTNPRSLQRAGVLEQGQQLNQLAVQLARDAAAAADRTIIVAASVAPVEDCYRPDLVPEEAELKRELTQMMEWQLVAQPDLVWIETANNQSEVRLAAAAAAERGLRFAVSFVLQEDGRLLDGSPLDEAVQAVSSFHPLAMGVNCVPPSGVAELLKKLRALTELRLSAYAHIGNAVPIPGWSYSESNVLAQQYVEHTRQWRAAGADLIGGCCGTTAAHIRAIAVDWQR